MIRTLLRRALLGANPVPQYAVVGAPEPQQLIRVELRGTGSPVDVTENNVAVSLRPLRIAVALSRDRANGLRKDGRADLAFIERARPGRELGLIRLGLEEAKSLGENVLCIFRSRGCTNRCIPGWKAMVYDRYRAWSARRHGERYNHQMSRADLQSFFVFYTCPRPVALVTVHTGDGGNIFPMDLIGPTLAPYFLLALHSTAPSVERIKDLRRITLSYVPVELTEIVYQLGQNHRVADVDWDSVPLPLQRSSFGGSPVPEAALEISAMSVEEAYDLGSHTLFVTRIIGRERIAEGLRMCHIQGFYQDYLRQRGERT